MRRSKTDNSYVLNYELNDNYPLIPNQNTYFEQEKMVCINSEDRNVIKYPESNSFEILLPTDIVNVSSIQLQNWMFPINTNTFSYNRNNLQIEFVLQPSVYSAAGVTGNLFDPLGTTGNNISENYNNIVNDVLLNSNTFIATINEGTYTDTTLSYEIQNQMNVVVDRAIIDYVIKNNLESEYTPYVFFNIIVSGSENKFWFVNTLNPFEFNDSKLYKTNTLIGEVFNPCSNDKMFTSYVYYGLPAYLGFQELPACSCVCNNKYDLTIMSDLYNTFASSGIMVNEMVPISYINLPAPSFQQNMINGNFLNVNFIKPLNSYTLVLYTHIYLELETLNCGDETKPFTNNEFTRSTNQGNGSVGSFIGRIPLFSTNSNYATSNGGSEKQPTSYFNPPLERLRKLKINLRYHDGTNVNFGLNGWDFALSVTSFLPTQNKKITKTPF